MRRTQRFAALVLGLSAFLGSAGLASAQTARPAVAPPVSLHITRSPQNAVSAEYRLARPARALHFAPQLDGYRARDWQPATPDFRWVREGDGERIERTDGQPFTRLTFDIPVRYRSLEKSYAPFSPFSDGGLLVYSGHFQTCTALPCKGTEPLAVTIAAEGATIGVGGKRTDASAAFTSREEGTNIYIGSAEPAATSGFLAIVDPALQPVLRDHLLESLPQSMRDFAAIYGALTITPELYVSLDPQPPARTGLSSQGGTLPGQVFIHLYGDGWRKPIVPNEVLWLDWFFAHEAAHFFQRAGTNDIIGPDSEGWIHEGGADAMAALVMRERSDTLRRYVDRRIAEARKACATGLASVALSNASRAGKFDLHYQCGMLIALAIDADVRRGSAGARTLHDVNRRFFATVRAGTPWNGRSFLEAARRSGVSPPTLAAITMITRQKLTDPARQIDAMLQQAGVDWQGMDRAVAEPAAPSAPATP
ncbi:hypothetical protein [Sphingomonas sp. 35-24ZXX]|uniref:hypothetical protein n=1 Tax=Sphingomonas sp. 35-24ZXX TaxID=1545915 RepID=UPI00053BEB1C|nr:hypothetical protein [Sphingomonas sp. 35-24ZXX]